MQTEALLLTTTHFRALPPLRAYSIFGVYTALFYLTLQASKM